MFLQNLRFATRLLVRQAGLTAIVVATFSLGIGLTGSMFALLHGALRELPFEAADRLLHLEQCIPSRGIPGLEVSIHDFLDWRRRQASFEDLAAFFVGSADLASPGQPPQRVRAAFVTAGTFPLLRVAPRRGRWFLAGEDAAGAPPVAMLGDQLWRRRFDGDPGVVGRMLRINGEPTLVVGIMPAGFRFPLHEDLWLPLRLDPARLQRGEGKHLEVFGRLRDGVSPAQARLDLGAVSARLAAEYPATNAGVGAVVKPYVEEFVPAPVRLLLWTMLGAVLGVLLVACVNVANLLLARTMLRSKELAVRVALGASRRQIAALLLTETFLAAALGTLGGLAFTWGALALFRRLIAATDPPFWIQFRVDLPVLAFLAALAALSAAVAGWLPALKAAGQNVGEALQDESRGASGYRLSRLVRALVVSEIAVTVALLSAAGLMIRTIVNLRALDYGFAPAEIVTARIDLPAASYPTAPKRRQLFAALRSRLAAVPGVRAAALATYLPVTPGLSVPFVVEGRPPRRDEDLPLVRQIAVSTEFLRTLQVHVREGRDFGAQDREDSLPVALVDTALAARRFAGEDPIGRRIRLGVERGAPWRTIVGVIPGLSPGGPEDREAEGVYVPLTQSDPSGLHLIVRPATRGLGIADELRSAAARLDPDLPLAAITLAEVIHQETWHYGVFGSLFLVFGAAALFLAAVGVSGVMAFSISRRTHEIGVRRALGARAADLGWLVARQAGAQLGLGLAGGLGLALLLGRAIRWLLFQVSPWDVGIFLAIAAVLALVCCAACALPVLRALRIDPAAALRQ